jgi:protein-disulfide isomerase
VADEEQTGTGRRQVWLGVAVALVVIVVLAVVSLTSGGQQDQAGGAAPGSPAQAQQQARDSAPRRIAGDPLAMGNPMAPVTIVEWADFQCPFCEQFFTQVEPTLVDKYVKTGQARFEWRDFAFLGPESNAAALGARAAAQQGKFWPFHDVLYREQHPENSGAITPAYLTDVARRVGLDVPRFQADLKNPQLVAQIKTDMRQGSTAGVNGTPAVIINGQYIDGAQSLDVYEHAIDGALAKASATR